MNSLVARHLPSPGPGPSIRNGSDKRTQRSSDLIGNAITGELKYLIPDPGDLSKMTDTGTSASGIATDDKGNICVADVGVNNLRKYTKDR